MRSHSHKAPVPPSKDPGDKSEVSKDTATPHTEVKSAEQGETANIRQNTTNKGFF